MMRAYSTEEEQELRKVVENRWLRGSYSAYEGPTKPHTYEQKITELEFLISTHKQAGHTAEYLLEMEKESARNERGKKRKAA